MKVAIVPHLDYLRVIVDSNSKVTPEVSPSVISSMYAPWPDAQAKGFAEIDIEGETLRALLAEVGNRYKQANVDFEPICPITNDLKLDYDVFVNGKKVTAPSTLVSRKEEDLIKIIGVKVIGGKA